MYSLELFDCWTILLMKFYLFIRIIWLLNHFTHEISLRFWDNEIFLHKLSLTQNFYKVKSPDMFFLWKVLAWFMFKTFSIASFFLLIKKHIYCTIQSIYMYTKLNSYSSTKWDQFLWEYMYVAFLADWFRTLIFSALNHSSSHLCA